MVVYGLDNPYEFGFTGILWQRMLGLGQRVKRDLESHESMGKQLPDTKSVRLLHMIIYIIGPKKVAPCSIKPVNKKSWNCIS